MSGYGKRVTVLGLGRSGYESALYLAGKGYDVFVSEKTASPVMEEKAGFLSRQGLVVETGGHSEERILSSDWVLISPGIAPFSEICRKLSRKGIPLVSEIEAASWFCSSRKIIAITGTCGKTTVTSLVSTVLRASGLKVVQCGNIGNPWIGELGHIGPDDVVVLELSSFQLFYCFRFKPWISVILNIAENHQDWHSSMEEYARAKARIFQNQGPEDRALLRRSDERQYFSSLKPKAGVIYFGENEKDNPNSEAVCKIAGLVGVSQEDCRREIAGFAGIEHRMEDCGSYGGIRYINDSKSTTTASLAWALQRFRSREVVLIAGGHPKSRDFGLVSGLLKQKVRKAVLIGEARELLARIWQDHCDCQFASSLEEAVRQASSVALPGDTVLLSPACASFDMFRNYEERGKCFKETARAVHCV